MQKICIISLLCYLALWSKQIIATQMLDYVYISDATLNKYTKVYNNATFVAQFNTGINYVLCVPLSNVITNTYTNSPKSATNTCVLTRDTSTAVCPVWLAFDNYTTYGKNCIQLPPLLDQMTTCTPIKTQWGLQNIATIPTKRQMYLYSKCVNLQWSYCYAALNLAFSTQRSNLQTNIRLAHNFTFCVKNTQLEATTEDSMLVSGMITVSIGILLLLFTFYIQKPERKQKSV